MFGLENNLRYFLWPEPVNMRKGIDGLFSTIISGSELTPMTGDVGSPATFRVRKCDKPSN